MAFEHALQDRSCLERALLAKGQYGGHVAFAEALVVAGMHTNTVVWWDCPVADAFLLSFEVKVTQGWACIWLCGPGYGNHPALGYTLRLPPEKAEPRIRLRRHDRPLGSPLWQPFARGTWYRFDILRRGGLLAVWVDGQPVGKRRDPQPLRGPMHAFVGLGAIQGLTGGRAARYRNLAIRMPEADVQRLAAEPGRRVLDPPIATPPARDIRLLATDDFAAEAMERWTVVRGPARVRGDRLEVGGPNAWPLLWRKEPLRGSFAVDVHVSYFPGGEAVNFFARLRVGGFIDAQRKSFRGWSVGFPRGDGLVVAEWFGEDGRSRVVASTPYFAPVAGRPYVVRLERRGSGLRVFANGGFLMEAAAPAPLADDAPLTPGMLQIYGGSRVERIDAWQINPLPQAPAGAGEGGDFGPRLAAAGNFAAALADAVHPLLAERRYAQARAAAAALGARPEFRLALDVAQCAEQDATRLERFWAFARGHARHRRLDGMAAKDVLALLGDDALGGEQRRLSAALFLLVDGTGDPPAAVAWLDRCPDSVAARRYRALARRRARRLP
ncbi:MAG: hypothetical protein ACLF0G_00355 [Candidatus Brocadiia bacterium]